MIKQIVRLAFEQATEETPNVSKTGLSKHISSKIEENDARKIFSYKTFTRYYDKYIEGKEGVINHPQPEIIEELCKYLGYENYQDCVSELKGVGHYQMSNDMPLEVEFSASKPLAAVAHGINTKEFADAFFLNKNLIKQLVLTVILILCFKVNWSFKEECDYCLGEHETKPSYHRTVYDEIMFKNTAKLLDSTYIFNTSGDLCYGGKRNSRSF